MTYNLDVIILAAGFGTRLYPLTENQPKALLKIGDTSILDILISRVSTIDAHLRIFIITNSKFYDNFKKWQLTVNHFPNSNHNIFILNDDATSNENRLGPIGDINFVLEKYNISNDLMIIASDNIIDFNMNDIILLRKQRDSSVLAAYNFNSISAVRQKFGVVNLNSDGRLLSFVEKPANPESSIAATGIYLIKNEDIKYIRALKDHSNIKEMNLGSLMIELLSNSIIVHCFLISKWFDIGVIDDLKKANIEYLKT